MDRRTTTLAVAAGCLLLTFVFLIAGFPYDRLEGRVVRAIETNLGGRMSFASSTTQFEAGLPGYSWEQVRISGTAGGPLAFDRVSLRPAWALSWLRLAPSVHVDLVGPSGRAVGVLTLGGEPGFDGRLEQYDLAKLPPAVRPAAFTLRGIADAELDLASNGKEWMGDVQFDVANGSVAGGRLRLPLPFSTLKGTFALVGDHRTEVSALHISGPMVKADLVGTVGPAESLGAAPLDLALELDAEARALPMLKPLGIKLTSRGPQSLKLGGTFDKPQVR